MPHDQAPMRGNHFGWGVLLAWCVMVGGSFWAILGPSHAGTTAGTLTATETALIGSWIATSPDYRRGRATVTWLRDAGCACKPMTRGQWRQLGWRWRRRNTGLHEMAAPPGRPPALAHVEIVVADAAGIPVYAGAFDDAPMCGNSTEMDVIVASAHALASSPFTRTSNRTCECP